MSAPQFVEINISSLDTLNRLYHDIYTPAFPDVDERESLENMQRYLELKAEGWFGKNNYHILAAFDGKKPIGMSISDYLATPNVGVMEFILVTPDARSRGIGSALLRHTEQLFLSDAQKLFKDAPAIVAEMNDPFAADSLDDNFDPFRRALLWSRWGYGRLDFPYVQPALSSVQKPVLNLLLMAKKIQGESRFSVQRLKLVLQDYMRLAMRIEHPERLAEFNGMVAYLDHQDSIEIAPLDRYVGIDPRKPLFVSEIGGDNTPDLDQVLQVYKRSFPRGITELDPREFRSLLSSHSEQLSFRYHLWAARSAHAGLIEGMASFFCFEDGAFGGYVTLTGSLHGTGYFPLLLARMEEQIRRDSATAPGWFIECAPAKESFFSRFGFHAVDFAYRQPPLPGDPPYAVTDAPPLILMYKELGATHRKPTLRKRELARALADILRAVYGDRDPDGSPFVQDMKTQTDQWPSEQVQFR